MMASTPRASSQRASSTVVADDRIFAPQLAHAAPADRRDGRPKWKLTTGGLNSLEHVSASASNGDATGPPGSRSASMPSSARYGARTARHRASRSALASARVAEEVDVERPPGLRSNRRQLPAHGIRVQHRARQRAEAAGVGDRDRQRAALHAGHRRLDDRRLDAQERLQRISEFDRKP